jgi:hypothetical protein
MFFKSILFKIVKAFGKTYLKVYIYFYQLSVWITLTYNYGFMAKYVNIAPNTFLSEIVILV